MHKRAVVFAAVAVFLWGQGVPCRAAPVEPSATNAPSAGSTFQDGLRELEGLERNLDFAAVMRRGESLLKECRDAEQARQMGNMIRRANDARKSAAKLAFAVQKLGAGNVQERETGERVLTEAGELGCLYLRHAFRTKEEAIARAAGQMLVQENDTNALPVFVEKLRADPGSPLGVLAKQGLLDMAGVLPKELLAALLAGVRADREFAATGMFEVLETVFSRGCSGDEQAMAERVGAPDTVTVLREYVSRAMLSRDSAAAAWACRRLPTPALLLMDGLRAQYFTNSSVEACAVDRLESRPQFAGYRAHRQGRPDSASVRWTGGFLVRTAGEYTITVSGRASAAILVDGRPLTWNKKSSSGWSQSLALSAGWHAIKADYVRPAGDGAVRFDVAEPGVRFCTPPWPGILAALAQAANELGSPAGSGEPAQALLEEAGGVGQLFLREAVRAGSAPQVKAAAAMLVSGRDKQAVGAVLSRLAAEKDEAVKGALTEAACALVSDIDPPTMAGIYAAAMAAGGAPMNPQVRILCDALVVKCHGEAEAFNRLVGDDKGYAALAERVRGAVASNSADTWRSAMAHGGALAPRFPGLLARGYADASFRNPVWEAVVPHVGLADKRFFPRDRGRADFSVQWSGLLRVEKPGVYAFGVSAQSGADVQVDGRLVAQSMFGQETHRDAVTLDKGWHKLCVEFRQTPAGGKSFLHLSWIPPGGGNEAIPAAALTCAPTVGMLAQLDKALAVVSASRSGGTAAAMETLRDGGEVALELVRRALRQADPGSAGNLALALVELHDASLPATIRELRAGKSPLAPKVDAALEQLARTGDREHAAWACALLKEDKALEFPALARYLAKVLQECQNRDEAFNKLAEDAQAAATLRAYLARLPKEARP
jgi:hypothetical protein